MTEIPAWTPEFCAEVREWCNSFPRLAEPTAPKPQTSKCPECGDEGPGNVCPRCDPWHYGDGDVGDGGE